MKWKIFLFLFIGVEYMTSTEKIKEAAAKQGHTFASLERELGFAQGSIRKWDNSIPSADKLAKVAELLSVSIDWLITDEGESPIITPLFDIQALIERLYELMKNRNITSYRMLSDLSLNQSLLYNWKNGSMPSVINLLKIAEYFQISLDWLLTGEGEQAKHTKPTPPSDPTEELILEEYRAADKQKRKAILQAALSDNKEVNAPTPPAEPAPPESISKEDNNNEQ